MSRNAIYKEIEANFGLVPSFFDSVPDSSLELEWHLFKRLQVEEGVIPNKYRELIGLGIAAATKCRFCTLYHTEMARLEGATTEEIEEAVHFAKCSTGWSTYINGLQTDYERFRDDIMRVCEHIRTAQSVAK